MQHIPHPNDHPCRIKQLCVSYQPRAVLILLWFSGIYRQFICYPKKRKFLQRNTRGASENTERKMGEAQALASVVLEPPNKQLHLHVQQPSLLQNKKNNCPTASSP